MSKVLGIAGSPRKGGNSDLLLDAFLEGTSSKASEVEKIYIADKAIAPCDEKNVCYKDGICHIRDDMQEIYEKLLQADCLVVAMPTFFMGPPAQLKVMIDRCQSLWAKRFIIKQPLRDDDKKRYGYLLSVSGLDKEDAFIGSKQTLKAFFYILGFKYGGELLIHGVDNIGDIKKREGALEEAKRMGESINI